MKRIPTIAIIGGGFSGTVTMMQLLKQANISLSVKLVNSGYPIAKGVAYSTYSIQHLLNVPAAKMSLFPDEPGHFIDWIKSKSEYVQYIDDELDDRYLPRIIYGRYIEEVFNDTLKNKKDKVDFEIIEDEALDIIPEGTKIEIILRKGKIFFADKVLLALGNFLPENPKIRNEKFFLSKKYFMNPWNKKASEEFDKEKDILIIGTGLTMIDNVLSLVESGFTGKIFAVSRNGFFPLSHKKRKPYFDILDELNPPYKLHEVYKIFRKHVKKVLSKGIPGEAVVDALRPKTQEIWLGLSYDDKIKFMAHLRHLWGVARHRVSMEVYNKMKELMSADKLEIIAGRFKDMTDTGSDAEAIIVQRYNQQERKFKVQRIINCTGPQTYIEKIKNILVQNLIRRGLIDSDEMKLGINALPDGNVIHKDRTVSNFLYTIGSPLKGILWESTAVPELRLQAQKIAEKLINELDPENAPTDIIIASNNYYVYAINSMSHSIGGYKRTFRGGLISIGSTSGLPEFATGLVTWKHRHD